MRLVIPVLALAIAFSGCSVNAGAGARLGQPRGGPDLECNSFESCDAAYQEALANAERCQQEESDCEDETRNLAAAYGVLREQTLLELDALRNEARAGAFSDEPNDGAPSEESHGPRPVRPPEPVPVPQSGNSWFDADSASVAH